MYKRRELRYWEECLYTLYTCAFVVFIMMYEGLQAYFAYKS